MTARMRVPRHTPMFRNTRPAVHPAAQPDDKPPVCPPCRRDDTCKQGRCDLAAEYLQRARHRDAAAAVRHRAECDRAARRANAVLAVIAAGVIALISWGVL
jgi:Tfp pilus assembly protein PilF